jgi:hypothetical protein
MSWSVADQSESTCFSLDDHVNSSSPAGSAVTLRPCLESSIRSPRAVAVICLDTEASVMVDYVTFEPTSMKHP